MIRVLALTDPRELLRRRVHSQPFCRTCGGPLCLSRAVSVETAANGRPGSSGEGRRNLAVVCPPCFEEMAKVVENPGSYTVLDGRKLFERKAKGGKP